VSFANVNYRADLEKLKRHFFLKSGN